MIVYLATKSEFRDDVFSNRIEEKVLETFKREVGKSVSKNEIVSWKNSLPYMDRILEDAEIPSDCGVAIEFNIPNTGKRIDFILTGLQDNGERAAVIVELKQWENVDSTPLDAIVSTFVGGSVREVSHPSYQAWSYAMLVNDFNETVQTDPINLKPCAYLHNCMSSSVIHAPHYKAYTSEASAFLKDDAIKLRNFIKEHVKFGDDGETIYRIRDGKIRPSKGLADHLASLLKGNQEFYLIDDQKLVYETAIHLATKRATKKKQVLIVNGGPGTGKSVVAVNLLVELTKRRLVVQYVTKNSAPRAVYESKLAKSMTKSRISNLFVGSGKFTETPTGTFDALIVDEAHRLNAKSGMFSNMGENQIKEIINASGFSVFFLDEDQRIHWKDIGEKSEILKWAAELNAEITELSLESQFRCNGSDGYLAWTDNTLQIRETANPTLEDSNYEFKVCETASELRDLIYERNNLKNSARMVAGYCWEWITKKQNPDGFDIEFPGQSFAAKWNLTKDGSLWILSPDSVKEVGCIHTCQGLEIDYVGVIIGPDLIIRDGVVETDATKRAKSDSSIKGYKKMLKDNPIAAREKADRIIKSTYRTLMTRGIKGCYVHSTDPETNQYLKEAARGAIEPEAVQEVERESEVVKSASFRILDAADIKPFENAVPLLDMKIAAGSFSPEQWPDDCEWVELPEPFVAKQGYFIAQVVGESMNRRIPNGSWCLFRKNPVGSREGKVVLVQHRDIQDADNGGQYTVKVYHSEKTQVEDQWEHYRISLVPDSSDEGYSSIELESDEAVDLQLLGELVAVLP